MKTIGVVGTCRRDFPEDFRAVKAKFLELYEDGDRICSGGCKAGGDRFAEAIARDLGLTMIIHYPSWTKFGRSAGFIRNTLIANDSDVLLACVSAERSGGTEDTVEKAKKQGTPIHIV
jgi:hypothetical protein